MDKTADWFAAHGLVLRRTGSDRDYAAEIDGADLELRLLSAGEIPRELAVGRIHLGVTGLDLVHERIPGWDRTVESIAPMGFGHADLVIAVPVGWVDVMSLDDLDAVAADFRARHGHRLRIATKYHRLVREFLRDAGVADYRLVDSQGATEATVAHGTAEAIADITSTGETLRANHLKILPDAVILRSEATLWRSLRAEWSDADRAAMAALSERLGLS
jgi:ATP phosphoribosyltransferase